MFKKKTTLPERPSPPTSEEMLEDLKYAKPDDIVFTFPGINSANKCNENEKSLDDSIARKHFTDSNSAYLEVKQFVEMYNKLDKSLPKLQRQNEELKMLRNELNEELCLLKQKAEADIKAMQM